jgi:hypothetical protein
MRVIYLNKVNKNTDISSMLTPANTKKTFDVVKNIKTRFEDVAGLR